MQYFFGSGALYGRQTGVSNPTPIRFGALQNATVEFNFTNKSLYGQYQFPLDTARGSCKITGKATFGALNGAAFNNLFFGETLGTTPTFTAIDEAQTVLANAVTVTNAATYVGDLGVINATDGQLLMTRVAATPSGTGNYAVNETTGVYTFNSAMNNKSVQVSYDYTGAAGAGNNVVIDNNLTGSGPVFLMVLAGSLKGNAMRMKLNACMSSKLGLGTKLDDYMTPDFEWESYADTTGNIGAMSFAQ